MRARALVVPAPNGLEAAVVEGLQVVAVEHLGDAHLDALVTDLDLGWGPNGIALAHAARDTLLADLGFRDLVFDAHGVATAARAFEVAGHVLANGIEGNGRVVAFAFAGKAKKASGTKVWLDAALAAPFSQQGLRVEYTTYVTQSEIPSIDRVVLSLRDNGASPHSVEHSLRKAHTALTYNMSSAEYGKGAAASVADVDEPIVADSHRVWQRERAATHRRPYECDCPVRCRAGVV